MSDLADTDAYGDLPEQALKDALKDAEELFGLLGSIHLRRQTFSAEAQRLRKMNVSDRHTLRLETASKITDMRMSLRRRKGGAT